jgi:hypothetical protein
VSRISKEAEQEKRLEAEKLEREVFLNDVRHVLSSVQGRRFVWRILDMAGVYRSSFTATVQHFSMRAQEI